VRPDVRTAPPAPSRRALSATLFAALAAILLPVGADSQARAGQQHRARIARTISVKDEGKLHFVKSSGSTVIDEGPAHGTIPGKVTVHFVYNGNPTVSSQITIYGHSGAIRAQANGRLSSPTSATPSFSGTLTITGGTGSYRHAHGTGKLYGVFYRRNYAMTVQAQGKLSY
jgi:hypothetical protein